MTFIRYAQNLKFGKTNNLKVLGNNKTKGAKLNSQSRLISPIPDGGEIVHFVVFNVHILSPGEWYMETNFPV
jgi:hypothetical protein